MVKHILVELAANALASLFITLFILSLPLVFIYCILKAYNKYMHNLTSCMIVSMRMHKAIREALALAEEEL